jgi:hypothetical protein
MVQYYPIISNKSKIFEIMLLKLNIIILFKAINKIFEKIYPSIHLRFIKNERIHFLAHEILQLEIA